MDREQLGEKQNKTKQNSEHVDKAKGLADAFRERDD
jgi:hypothetical protein